MSVDIVADLCRLWPIAGQVPYRNHSVCPSFCLSVCQQNTTVTYICYNFCTIRHVRGRAFCVACEA